MINLLLTLVLCYLIGSFPTGILAGRIFRKIDIRKFGSGNTGATNSFRVLGPRLGMTVAVFDFLKGAAAVALVIPWNPLPGGIPDPRLAFVTGLLAVVLGHVKPVFAGFRGGMGFNSAAGGITAAYPFLAPFCLILFLLVLTLTGQVAITAVITALGLPLLYLLTARVMHLGVFDPLILLFFSLVFVLVAFSVRKKALQYLRGEAELFEKIMIFRRRGKP